MVTPFLALVLAMDPDPALLARIAARTTAMEAFQKNSELTLQVTADELDGSGKPAHTEVYRYRVRQKDGESSRELLAHSKDGQDATDTSDEKDRPARKKKGDKHTMAEASPFHPEEQGKYEFTVLEPRPEAPQLMHLGFKPKGEKSDELMAGDATVDAATGDLVSLSMRPSKMPFMVDYLSVDAELGASTSAGRAMSKMVMKGQAGLPFFKKRFKVLMEFSDYKALDRVSSASAPPAP